MRGALALILPSEIEGFGLPALEAYPAARLSPTSKTQRSKRSFARTRQVDFDWTMTPSPLRSMKCWCSTGRRSSQNEINRATFLMGGLCRTNAAMLRKRGSLRTVTRLKSFSQTDRQRRLWPFARKLLGSGLG